MQDVLQVYKKIITWTEKCKRSAGNH